MSTRHTSTPKGCFVLRADSIRPYSPMGKLLPFIERFRPVSGRVDEQSTSTGRKQKTGVAVMVTPGVRKDFSWKRQEFPAPRCLRG